MPVTHASPGDRRRRARTVGATAEIRGPAESDKRPVVRGTSVRNGDAESIDSARRIRLDRGLARLLSGLLVAVLFGFLTGPPAFGQRWPDERMVGPFRFHADFGLADSLPALHQTARLSKEIPALLALPPGEETIWVYLFRDESTYRRYLGQYFPDVPIRRALYIKPRGPGMVFAFAGDGFTGDLRHESTHAILHTLLPSVPLWLDEGLAEYFETSASDSQARDVARESVLQELGRHEAPRLEQLERKTDMRQMGAQDYRHAWAWVHFLLHGPEPARRVFREYLRELQVAEPALGLAPRLMRECPDLEEAFALHMQSLGETNRDR